MRIAALSAESGFTVATVAPRIVGGEPQPRQLPDVEAPGDDLVEAEVAHHVLRAPPQRCSGLSPPTLAVLGQGPRELIEAVEAPDLLDQVDLAADVVVAVERDGRRQVPSSWRRRSNSRPLRGAASPRRARCAHRAASRAARRCSEITCGAGISAATSIVPGAQLRAARARRGASRPRAGPRIASSGWSCFSKRVEASERRPELARGPQDVHAVPGRRLEQHARGLASRPRRPGRP